MTENVVAGAVRIDDPKDARKVFLVAFNAGDIERLTNFFEPEAVIVVSPDQVITGLTAIREAFAQFRATWQRWEIKLISHHRVGDIALNTVEHTLYNDDPDGRNTLTLRAAVVFRRQADGSWRFLIDNAAPFE